jgi:hypothetical protein
MPQPVRFQSTSRSGSSLCFQPLAGWEDPLGADERVAFDISRLFGSA